MNKQPLSAYYIRTQAGWANDYEDVEGHAQCCEDLESNKRVDKQKFFFKITVH